MTDSPESPRSGERIAKLLARAGIASRREIERMIADGRVKLDGEPITTPATVLETLRGITVDDQPVRSPEAARLFIFHKPSGLITAERDPAGRPTIYAALRNAIPRDAPRLMPVGRLDLNTEGLLLLTNDGALKRALELPSSGIPRTYRARTFGDISQDRLEELMGGIEIDGIRYGPINANMERRTGRNQWVEMTLTEGKNREVRRVLEHLGLQVSRLLRVSYGPFDLGELQRGSAEEVPGHKVDDLLRQLKVSAPTEVAPRRRTPLASPAAPAPAAPARSPARGRTGKQELRNPGPAKPGERREGNRDHRRSERPYGERTPLAGKVVEASGELRNPGPAKPGSRIAPRKEGRRETDRRTDARPGEAPKGRHRGGDDGQLLGRNERPRTPGGPAAGGRRSPGRNTRPGPRK